MWMMSILKIAKKFERTKIITTKQTNYDTYTAQDILYYYLKCQDE